MVGIYKITNLKTGECYIGRSIHVEERWKEHFCKGYGAIHSKRFQDAIDQYGKDGFSFRLIEECDPEVLDERERFWINSLKPAYNTVTEGHPVSEETRAKISESLAGRKQLPELVEKRRQAILERHKTHPQTNEGHKKKVAVEEETITVFDSVKDCAEYLGLDASTVTKALKQGKKIHKKKVWYVV
jgi:group I intron endonuclease